MAGLARRIAPAAALGGLAVVVVGLFDPALAARNAQAEQASAEQAPQQQQQQQTAPQQQEAVPQQQQQAAPQQQEAVPQDQGQQQASSGDCSNGEQITGESSMTPWGPVQVVGLVANGQICQAQAIAYPVGDRKSQMINSYAIPVLDAQASQGTQVDFVSGATYTSNAYAQSLQSILDQL